MPAAAAAATPAAESSTTMQSAGSTCMRVGGEQEQIGRRLAVRTWLAENSRGSKEAQQAGDFEAEADAIERRGRCHGLWPANPGQRMGGMGERPQLRAQAPQRFCRNARREIRRQLSSRRRLRRWQKYRPAGGRETGAPGSPADTVTPMLPQRVGQHRSRDRLTVDKYAIAIEDDHGSLRGPAQDVGRRPAFRGNYRTTISFGGGNAKTGTARAPEIMHKNAIYDCGCRRGRLMH